MQVWREYEDPLVHGDNQACQVSGDHRDNPVLKGKADKGAQLVLRGPLAQTARQARRDLLDPEDRLATEDLPVHLAAAVLLDFRDQM